MVLALLVCGRAEAVQPVVGRVGTESEKGRFILKVSLNTRLAPQVFALDVKGPNPRVVVDFRGALGAKSLPAKINTDSPLVRSLRIGIHPGLSPKVRLVLDLVPGLIYQVDQWFRRDINSYILVLSAQ